MTKFKCVIESEQLDYAAWDAKCDLPELIALYVAEGIAHQLAYIDPDCQSVATATCNGHQVTYVRVEDDLP